MSWPARLDVGGTWSAPELVAAIEAFGRVEIAQFSDGDALAAWVDGPRHATRLGASEYP